MEKMDQLGHYGTWSTEQVVSWLRGLDDALEVYLGSLHAKGLTGKWLVALTPQELARVGVEKVGHQMLIMEGVSTLFYQYYALETESLQTVLLRVACNATSVATSADKRLQLHALQIEKGGESKEAYPFIFDDMKAMTNVMVAAVLKLMTAVDHAVSWLERAPFSSLPDMLRLRNELVDRMVAVNRSAQLIISSNSLQRYKDIMNSATAMKTRLDDLIKSSEDSLFLTPCSLELVQIRKAENVDFGFNIRSTSTCVHIIEAVQNDSPAFCTGKIDEGDEVVEVNDQVVIGWQHKRVVELMKTHTRRVTLRLRKRPAHSNDFGYPGARRHRPHKPMPIATTHPRFLTRPNKRSPLPASMVAGAAARVVGGHVGGSCSTPSTPVMSARRTGGVAASALENMVAMSASVVVPLTEESGEVEGGDGSGCETTGSIEGPGGDDSPLVRPRVAVRRGFNANISPTRFGLGGGGQGRLGPASEDEETGAMGDLDDSGLHKTSSGSPFVSPQHFPSPQSTHLGKGTSHLTVVDEEIDRMSLDPTASKKEYLTDDVKLRRPVRPVQKKSTRRISCKDLGQGDCQGWLWLKKSNTITTKYVKRWCICKHSTLYYYRLPEDEHAEGLIILPGFTISPVAEVKSGRYGFRVYNEWVVFVFASESEQDRSKWMNKLGLAAIRYDTAQAPHMGGFTRGYLPNAVATSPAPSSSLISTNNSGPQIVPPLSPTISIASTSTLRSSGRSSGGGPPPGTNISVSSLPPSAAQPAEPDAYFTESDDEEDNSEPEESAPGARVRTELGSLGCARRVTLRAAKLRTPSETTTDSNSATPPTPRTFVGTAAGGCLVGERPLTLTGLEEELALREQQMERLSKVRRIERLIREKTAKLDKLDAFLKGPVNRNTLTDFMDDYSHVLTDES